MGLFKDYVSQTREQVYRRYTKGGAFTYGKRSQIFQAGNFSFGK